jgi:hypothetical protein
MRAAGLPEPDPSLQVDGPESTWSVVGAQSRQSRAES